MKEGTLIFFEKSYSQVGANFEEDIIGGALLGVVRTDQE